MTGMMDDIGGKAVTGNSTVDDAAMWAKAYAELSKAVGRAGFDINFKDGGIYLTAKDSAPAGSGEVSSLIDRLEAAASAYPEDVFGATTGEDRALHGDVVQRAAATMGRHMAPMMLQAAALLRNLQQGADYVMVPRELTAENGAKAALTGEVQVRLREGQPWVPVSWTAIKELHRKMIAHFDRAASQGQEGG